MIVNDTVCNDDQDFFDISLCNDTIFLVDLLFLMNGHDDSCILNRSSMIMNQSVHEMHQVALVHPSISFNVKY